MMQHHPSEETLFAYSCGNVAEAHLRVIEAHAARCPACALALRQTEQIGGGLLEALTPLPLSAGAFERTLVRAEAAPTVSEPAPAEPPAMELNSLMQGRWRWRGRGIAMQPLLSRDADGSRLALIRVAPGVALLEHDHSGYETCCILQGAYHDGVAEYRIGDFAEADRGFQHRPRALPGEDCICLIATTGHMRPRSLVGRLVRPVLGL